MRQGAEEEVLKPQNWDSAFRMLTFADPPLTGGRNDDLEGATRLLCDHHDFGLRATTLWSANGELNDGWNLK
jgi:hypothetical protein